MSPTADRFREDYDPEPDYERPTKAEAEAERQRYTAPPPRRVVLTAKAPSACTDRELGERLRLAADRVVGSRPDLAALLEEAAERLTGEPF